MKTVFNEDKDMLFAILILMVLITSASIRYWKAPTIILFMATIVCTLTVLIVDIDAPLRLAF
jgi:hypothetical protein